MLKFIEDTDNPGCFFVRDPEWKYDMAIGYVSKNKNGVFCYHPSVSYLYTPETLEEVSSFIACKIADEALRSLKDMIQSVKDMIPYMPTHLEE